MPHSSSAHPATLVSGIPAPPGYGGPVRATLADTLGRAGAPAARIVMLPAHEARRCSRRPGCARCAARCG